MGLKATRAIMDLERLTQYGGHKDHNTFARLLPSQKRMILNEVAKHMAWPAQVETFVTSPFLRTYVVVRLNDRHEYVTYLVAFGAQGAYFDNGHYGFREVDLPPEGYSDAFREAIRDMFDRAVS